MMGIATLRQGGLHSHQVAADLVAADPAAKGQAEVVLLAMICGQAVVDTQENLSLMVFAFKLLSFTLPTPN
jgi:hypothetical protein